MSVDVRTLYFTYSEHPLTHELRKVSERANLIFETTSLPLYDHVEQKRLVDFVIRNRCFSVPDVQSLQLISDSFFAQSPVFGPFGSIGLVARMDGPKDQCVDRGHDLARIANFTADIEEIRC